MQGKKCTVGKRAKKINEVAFTRIDPKSGKLTKWTATVKIDEPTDGRRS